MSRGIITISETGAVTMPTAPVWMMQFEIADLFGVFSCDVRKAIHAIYKNKGTCPVKVCASSQLVSQLCTCEWYWFSFHAGPC